MLADEVGELEQEPNVAVHGAADVEDEQESRNARHAAQPWDPDGVAAGGQAETHRASEVGHALAFVALAAASRAGGEGADHAGGDAGEVGKVFVGERREVSLRRYVPR